MLALIDLLTTRAAQAGNLRPAWSVCSCLLLSLTDSCVSWPCLLASPQACAAQLLPLSPRRRFFARGASLRRQKVCSVDQGSSGRPGEPGGQRRPAFVPLDGFQGPAACCFEPREARHEHGPAGWQTAMPAASAGCSCGAGGTAARPGELLGKALSVLQFCAPTSDGGFRVHTSKACSAPLLLSHSCRRAPAQLRWCKWRRRR